MTTQDSQNMQGTGFRSAEANRRQLLYWRLLARVFDPEEHPSLESASVAIVDDLDLPPALLDPGVSVDNLVQRFPGLAAEFEALANPTGPTGGSATDGDTPTGATGSDRADGDPANGAATGGDTAGGDTAGGDTAGGDTAGGAGSEEVRRAALISKLLLNTFQTGSGSVTAGQLGAWQKDAGWLKAALGEEGAGEVKGVLAGLEGDLVGRMRLREVLADPKLASRLTPSMSLIEQLLRDKANLSGVALANAKSLIRRYVDEVAEVLRTQVQQTSAGTVDRSVPPKRVFRNLDLDRTIWKNLTNWSPEDERLYVDKLFYRHTAKRTTPAKMIVVVDQSGSMVDSMVNCTILASIFAGLPKVDVHLIAFDTRAIDLTPWVNDPFEVLLRTNLGGGNDGPVAMEMARPKITDPRNTVMVWISDFYEFGRSQALYAGIEAVHRSGVKFIPVGSVNSSGTQIVEPWFRQRFKNLGTPVISGKIQKLVFELKNFLA
ncbi:VWA domain-containing protein [Actinomadura sp. KC345]|uniref:VWA domain-containing protein n=1 Tax=Actinomadura sp. KC345 TaxID=2530371 RepID=UPI0010433A28|nr:VWA domain-containing protein [Actinomadura sp. KC345]TDC55842.1 VWA domain-containing protein [Actinomadura sp. KC345]